MRWQHCWSGATRGGQFGPRYDPIQCDYLPKRLRQIACSAEIIPYYEAWGIQHEAAEIGSQSAVSDAPKCQNSIFSL